MTNTLEILIVEDVDTMRSLLEMVIGGIPGFRVSGSARNTWDARLELSRRRPGLVLLDEILPGESSLDLLVEILALGIPVFMITGLEHPTHAVPEGVLGRLVKPGWDALELDRERIRVAIEGGLTSQPKLG